MGENEAIFLIGSEQYSDSKGYAFTLRFGGNFVDQQGLFIFNSFIFKFKFWFFSFFLRK
jgi:hypothetical protein